MAISMRLNTRRRTTVATATRLPPPYQVRGRNDKVGAREICNRIVEGFVSLARVVRRYLLSTTSISAIRPAWTAFSPLRRAWRSSEGSSTRSP